MLSRIGEFTFGAGLLTVGLHMSACFGALCSLPTWLLLSRLVFVVVCRILVTHLSLHFLFLFFCFRFGCCTFHCWLLLWAILRFLRCLLMLLFVLPQFLLVPLNLFLLFRCWHVLFLLFWYIGHRNIFVRFLLLRRNRGLIGRPGGRLVTKGHGALCKDSSRRHRSIPFGFLRVPSG